MATATTGNTGPSQINYADPTGAVLNFINSQIGTNTGTTGTTTGSATTTNQGQTAQLEAILAQLMDPQALQDLVANLFAQGAANVPTLTGQFANATGTRVSNNSMLSDSLAKQNVDIATAIAQAINQQRQIAAQAAADLGRINTTQSSNERKTQDQTVKQRPGNPYVGPLVLGGGMALNRLGRPGGILAPSVPGNAAPSLVPEPQLLGGPEFPNPVITPEQVIAPDAPTAFNAGMDFGINQDGYGFSDIGGVDFSDNFDVGAFDPGGNFTPDFDAGALDFSEFDLSGLSDFGFGFADGGEVGATNPMRRNQNFMGPRPIIQLQPTVATPTRPAQPPVVRPRPPVTRRPDSEQTISDGDANPAPGTAIGNPASLNLGVPTAVGAIGTLGAIGAGVNPVTAAMMGIVSVARNVAVQNLIQALVGTTPTYAMPAAVAPEYNLLDVMPPAQVPTMEELLGTEETTSSMPAADPDAGPVGGMPGAIGGEGTEGMDAGSQDPTGDSETGVGGDTSSGDNGDSGGDDGTGGADSSGFYDGGKVKKKGNRNRTFEYKDGGFALDTERARLTPGEVVLPVDTVQMIEQMAGSGILEELIAATHTPIRRSAR